MPLLTRALLHLGILWAATAIAFGSRPADPSAPPIRVVHLVVSPVGGTVEVGATLSLSVVARYSNGEELDVTDAPGTRYTSLDQDKALVEDGGLVQGVAPGVAALLISHETIEESSQSQLIHVTVVDPMDSDGDGMPDSFEVAHGFDPNSASDADEDADGDGLTNREEWELGTSPVNADTDGDGIPDGVEVNQGTNPRDPASPERDASEIRLDDSCTATVLNRAIQLDEFGNLAIPNVPVEPGYFRVRITCVQRNVTLVGQSGYFTLSASGPTEIGPIEMGRQDPMPVSVSIRAAGATTLTARGQTTQLTATATLPDGTTADVSTAARGTFWSTSNPGIATVSADGLVTAVSRGQAIIQANNEGVLSSLVIQVLIPLDADGDGMSDEYERTYGFNLTDATDATQDADGDGLTNLRESELGTNPRQADTDGDGLTDAVEVAIGTNPLRADTDGDGLNDGQEVALGTDPTLPDTDGDGIRDAIEVRLGLNPVEADATTTVRGRVVGPDGAPVFRVTVVVFEFLTAVTDADGAFELPWVPAGKGPFDLVAQSIVANRILDGRVIGIEPVAGSVTDIGTMALSVNAGLVAGMVRDSTGNPVADAQLQLTMGVETRSTRSDAEGRYRFTNITPGAVTVVARDYRTGLRGRGAVMLAPESSAVVDIGLGPFGTVRGQVLGRDASTPVPAGVQVRLTGPASLVTVTDGLGRYVIDFVPLGTFTVEATDTEGNRGRSTGNLATTGRTVVADITFLGRGTVQGSVFTGSGAPAAGVTVTVNSRSVFGGSATVTTGDGNTYSVPGVNIGPFDVTAVATVSRLAGTATGTIESEGQTVTANVTLTSAGTFVGTVFEADGLTPVAGAEVALSPTGLRAVTDGEGRYRFDFVPLGSYSFSVSNPANGDRGTGSGNVAAQDQVQTVNMSLRGFGTVQVAVRDGAGAPVTGAAVTVSGTGGFSFQRNGTTDGAGGVAFTGVLAGSFQVSAQNPATGLSGSASGTVAAGGTANVTVNLQPSGGIFGRLLGPDTTTPVAGFTVRVSGPISRSMVTGSDGAYSFVNLPLGTYSIDARDGRGRQRASSSGLVLATEGQRLERDLVTTGTFEEGTLIFGGTVRGRATFGDGSGGANLGVNLASAGGGFFTRTDIDGFYQFNEVPPGAFTATVNARVGNNAVTGSATGTLSNHGATATADIVLGSLFDPPSTVRYDANDMFYDVMGDGRLGTGTQSIFAGPGVNRAASALEVVVGGVAHRFSGDRFGDFEEGGREIVMVQTGVGGLNVVRKVYVPVEGYFARHLEIFSNPGGEPITFAARTTSHLRFFTRVEGGFTFQREPRILSTSSGDTLLMAGADGDRWVLLDDDRDGDPFLTATLPPTARVFDGPGGAVRADTLNYTLDFGALFGRLIEQWQPITVGPGETVALMHFWSQQASRAAGAASAGRLVQLPPEALAGLSATERAQIRNFSVPADGTSPLPPLPPLIGTVEGTVLAADEALAVPGARVTFQSLHPLFARTRTLHANSLGRFTLTGAVPGNGSSRPVPLDGFTLIARDGPSGFDSTEVTGVFPSGFVSATRDIIFDNAGIVSGAVRRAAGEVVTAGTVSLTGDALLGTLSTPISGIGEYLFRVVPPGDATVTATLPIAGGTALRASAAAAVVAGERREVDLVLPATGDVGGIVRHGGGGPAVNVLVFLRGTGFERSVATGTGGEFGFTDVPVGDYTLVANEPNSAVPASAPVTVVADTRVTQDLMLIELGVIELQANYSSGPPVGAATVQVRESARGTAFRNVGNTDGAGRLTVRNVTRGTFTLRVIHPGNGSLSGEATGSVTGHGQVVPVTVAVPVDAPPTVALTAPTSGQSFLEGSGITLAATATDDLGIHRVQFLVDEVLVATDLTSPYAVSYFLPQVTEDTAMSVVAVAVDTGGNSSRSAPAVITVRSDTTPPTVAIQSPAAGAVFLEGDVIAIQVTAFDNAGVSRVEFGAGGTVLGSDTTAPYQWSYRVPDDYAEGGRRSLALTATAYDPSGLSATVERVVNIDPYDQPSITIADASLREGNIGISNMVFEVRLSEPGSRTVTVRYATADQTATAGSDYGAVEGTLTFSPGQTVHLITVAIVGDTEVEPDETFLVNLSEPTNADLADGQAVGTILDDDGIPGRVHRFLFGSVESPRFVTEPFPVAVTAVDAAGDPVTDYDGTVTLRGIEGDLATGFILGNAPDQFSYNSTITVGYSFTPSADITVTHFRHRFGTRVSLWRDDGTLVATREVGSSGATWTESLLPAPVTLRAGTRYRLGAYSGGGTVRYRTDGSSSFAHGTIHQSQYRSGDGFPVSTDGARWYLVDIRYVVGNAIPVVPATLTGFSGGVWSGNVTVGAPSEAMRLAVDDGDGHLGESGFFAAELRNDVSVRLTAVPDPVEVGELLTYSIAVSNSGPAEATGVVLTQQLPAGAVVVEAVSTQGTPSVSGTLMTCPIGTLGAGAVVTVTVTVRPTLDGLLRSTATAVSESGDTFEPNNTASLGTIVHGPVADAFEIARLGTTGVVAAEVASITGDDRSALAVGRTRVLYTGDTATGSLDLDTVADGVRLATFYDSLVSDLRTRTVYALGNGGAPLGQGGTLTYLLPIDEVTGAQIGSVTREIWTGITGTAIADIPVGTPPTRVDRMALLESPPNIDNNYGVRLRARIMAPATGDYVFWVAGDDTCELWLSTGSSAGDRVLVASVPGATGYREWTRFAQQRSALIPLTAGQSYYVEALMKEGSGGDHLSVGWSRPGQSTDAPGELIPASVLTPHDGSAPPPSTPVSLSQSITLPSGSGIFAGYGRVVVHNGSRVFSIALPGGEVTDLGAMAALARQSTEGWAYWGIAEHVPDGVSLVYVRNSTSIFRTSVPDGATTTVGTFANLSDMGVISAAPSLGRWYFHHEGTSQFRSGDETVGYADADFRLTLAGEVNDLSLAARASADPALLDSTLTYTLTVANTGPDDSTEVRLASVLPSGVSFVSAESSQGTVTRDGTRVDADLGTLGAGASVTVTVRVTPVVVGTLEYRIEVTRAEEDFYLRNNGATLRTPVHVPTLVISDASVAEGDAGLTPLVFTVGLSAAVNREVRVNYSTSGGSAQSGSDFVFTNGVLVLAPGAVSGEVVVQIMGDVLYEFDETFSVFLSGSTNATIADNQGIGTILNDDPQPSLSIASATIVEPNVGISNLVFTVTLSAPSGVQARVNYATADGTATAPQDYGSRSGTLVFNPGQTVQTIVVPVVGEVLPEEDETFTVNLSSPVNATIEVATAVGTIVDNDSASGQIHHFTVGAVGSPQAAGGPFAIAVTARDAAGDTVTDYAGTPAIRAADRGTGERGNLLGTPPSPSGSSGNWTLGYSFTPTEDIEVTHVRHYFGTKVSIWRDDGTLVVAQGVSSVPGTWVETPLPSPVILSGGIRYRVAAYTGSGAYYWRTDLPATFPHGTLDVSYQGSGDVLPTSPDGVRWWYVDLAYRQGRNVGASPSNLAGFVDGVWTGNLTLAEPGTEVRLFVDDGDGHVGESVPFEVHLTEDLRLMGSVGPEGAEVGEELAYTLTVNNDGASGSTGVTLRQELPAYVYFESASASQGSCSQADGVVTCALGSMAAGSEATVTVTVRIAGDGPLASTATVSRTEAEFYLPNNTVNLQVVVAGPGSFRIESLTAGEVLAIEHASITGDDRGGIAISEQNVFYTGDNATGRFPLATFPNGGISLGTRYEGLVSDLRSRVAYLLGTGTTPLPNGGGTMTTLLELDGATGVPNGSVITLSAPISLASGSGIFAGYGRIVLHNGSRVYQVSLPDGEVTDLGAMAMPARQFTESWAFWGVAEHQAGEIWLVNVQNSQTILRTRVPDGATEVVGAFSNLSDMASITVAPWLGRWFFHHEGTSQFRSGDETIGSAAASFLIGGAELADDLSITGMDSPDPVGVGAPLTYTFTVANTGPSVATEVVFVNPLPSGVTYVSASASAGSCGHDGGMVTCELGDLGEGESATVTIEVTPTDAGVSLSNTARVTRGEPDFYLPNNMVSVRTLVVAPELTITGVELMEGDDGTTEAVFTVTLSAATSRTVEVSFEAYDGSATGGEDFEWVSGVLEILPFETSGQIVVLVYGDLQYEDDESFGIYLFDPVNATLAGDWAEALILNDDSPPELTLGDASTIEGNVGSRQVVFEVTLSEPSGKWTGLSYQTENRSAVAGEDYLARSDTLWIAPGALGGTIGITVFGDVVPEADEEFALVVLGVIDAEMAGSEAIGTILDDDAVPGRIHRFEVAAVSSPQSAGVPFAVTVTAHDFEGTGVEDYDGSPRLLALALGGAGGTLLEGAAPVSSSSGNFTLGYEFTPSADVVVTHVRSLFGTKVSLWTASGDLLGEQAVPGTDTWIETPLASPVPLRAGTLYRIGAYTGPGTYRWVGNIGTFPHGNLGNSYFATGDGFPASPTGSTRWAVDLRYVTGRPLEVEPATLTGWSGGVWSGDVTVGEAGVEVVLRVDDLDGHVGDSNGFVVTGTGGSLHGARIVSVRMARAGAVGAARSRAGEEGRLVVLTCDTGGMTDWVIECSEDMSSWRTESDRRTKVGAGTYEVTVPWGGPGAMFYRLRGIPVQ